MNDLYEKGDFEQCKTKTEEAMRKYSENQEPENAKLYIVCAKANFKLGYLIFAENLLEKCL